jgi:hypothetical protein
VPVRHGSRSTDIPFDWENTQTWAPALARVGSVYLTYSPDLAVADEAERAEDVVRASGLEWTIVRATWFTSARAISPTT